MKYQIQVAGPANEWLVFGPTGQRLRGRCEFARCQRNWADSVKELAQACPVIPGIILEIDTDRGIGTILDPLKETREGKEIFAKVQAVYQRHPQMFGEEVTPWPKSEHKLDADGVKTWLWAFRSAVDCNLAIVPASSEPIPKQEDISAMPGRRVRDPLNSGPQTNELSKYADEVPVSSGGRKAKEVTS